MYLFRLRTCCALTVQNRFAPVSTDAASQTYERPALRKAFAAFPADSKVANASLAVIATVVSTSDKLPPPAAASTAEAAAFSSGNSPMTSQSW